MTDDRQILDALADTDAEPDDAGDLISFYHSLLSLIYEKKQTIALDLSPQLQEFDAAAQSDAGTPALTFDWLGVADADLAEWVDAVAAVLREQLEGVTVPANDELMLLAREFYAVGTTGIGVETDALLHNSLAPWLELAAEELVPLIDVDGWQRGYCPVCGGYPDFATLRSARERRLMCERCRAEWPFPAGVCPFCGEMEPENLGYYGTPDDVYRVDVCDSCGFYIKGVDARYYAGDLLPEYERLLTPGLDLMATQEGYARPAGWREE